MGDYTRDNKGKRAFEAASQKLDPTIVQLVRLLARNAADNDYKTLLKTGADLFRPGYQNMFDCAQHKDFDDIVAESADRLSRDNADFAMLHKQLEFMGVRIATFSQGGILDGMHIGLHGIVSQMEREQTRKRVHRGLRGRVAAGRSAGGCPYGYKVPREFDQNNELITGKRDIVPEQAWIINCIMEMYAGGHSPKAIAK